MERTDDILIPADTSWLVDPNAQAVCAAVQAGGYDIYFVGGCVRNALLGLADSDVDMATNATPDVVTELAQAADLRPIPTGIEHGTITIVAGGAPFEVTTFRRDVATDGRRAVVAFSDNVKEDAQRRDFTMNALYATPEGVVIDPLNGLPDLVTRQVRFIQDPTARIREDYLRILRFFRFSAWYSEMDHGFDSDALAAIAANTDGLSTLSAERVGQEMLKLLQADDPAPAIASMRQTGVLSEILPGTDDHWLGVLIHLEKVTEIQPAWIARLAVLGGDDVAERLRLSKAQARQLALLQQVGFAGPSLGEIAYRHGREMAQHVLLMRSAVAEREPDMARLDEVENASQSSFPIKAADLMDTHQGPALGARLRELEAAWIASGFTMSRAELLKYG